VPHELKLWIGFVAHSNVITNLTYVEDFVTEMGSCRVYKYNKFWLDMVADVGSFVPRVTTSNSATTTQNVQTVVHCVPTA
jgi:hypothetical protein